MPRAKKQPTKQPLHIRSLALTDEDVGTLQYLSQDATDFTGRRISSSAIMRALVHYAGQQSETWAREQLFPFVESELNAGVLWGKRKR